MEISTNGQFLCALNGLHVLSYNFPYNTLKEVIHITGTEPNLRKLACSGLHSRKWRSRCVSSRLSKITATVQFCLPSKTRNPDWGGAQLCI